MEPLPDAIVIPLVAIVFAAFGAIVQARATRTAAKWTIEAQRAVAYDAAMRQRRQDALGGFVPQAQACVGRYIAAQALTGKNSLSMLKLYEASMNDLAATQLVPPIGLDDEHLRGVVERFVNLELQERTEVLSVHGFSGRDVHERETDALNHAVPLLKAALEELQAAADAYVFGDRPVAHQGWWRWLAMKARRQ